MKYPIVSLFFFILSLWITIAFQSQDPSLFGVDNANLKSVAFYSAEPFRDYGLSLLTSAFTHITYKHLFLNLLFFMIFSFLIEIKIGPSGLFKIFTFTHLGTLSVLTLFVKMHLLLPTYYAGLSHVAFGFIAFWSVITKKKSLFVVSLGLLIVQALIRGIETSILPHFIGFLMGSVAAYTKQNFVRWRKRSQC